jgi:hypothetical protein
MSSCRCWDRSTSGCGCCSRGMSRCRSCCRRRRRSRGGCCRRCGSWRRRGWLVSERASEFLHTPIAAVKSASGNMHGVLARYHRRGVEVEEYGVLPAYHDHTVRRSAVHREIACLKSCLINGITQPDCEVRWRTTHNNTATRWGSTDYRAAIGCWRWCKCSRSCYCSCGRRRWR